VTRPIWFPTADGELLLRAAVAEGDEAERAWRRWRGAHADEQFDLGSFRLLPLVYRNLEAHGSADEWMGRLKGLYRRQWFLNQSLLARAAEAVAALEAAGVPTLLLKGAGLSVAHYRDLGARAMDDVDVAVALRDAGRSVEVLREIGLRPARPLPPDHLALDHAETFTGAGGARIDLHWDLLRWAGADDAIWAAAEPAELRGAVTRTPCATDHLLLVCGHAAYWNVVHPLRWVADVLMVLRSDVDWDRLVRLAAQRGIAPPLAAALAYVREAFGAPVPPEAIGALRRARTPPLRRAAHRVAALPPSPARSIGLFAVYADAYTARARARGVRPTPHGFARSVQRHLEVADARELVVRIARGAVRQRRPAPVMAPRARQPAGTRVSSVNSPERDSGSPSSHA
jgi:hypothetical protein